MSLSIFYLNFTRPKKGQKRSYYNTINTIGITLMGEFDHIRVIFIKNSIHPSKRVNVFRKLLLVLLSANTIELLRFFKDLFSVNRLNLLFTYIEQLK